MIDFIEDERYLMSFKKLYQVLDETIIPEIRLYWDKNL